MFEYSNENLNNIRYKHLLDEDTNQSLILCRHITSLCCAEKIIEEKVFYPYDFKNKYCGDNGLNLLSDTNNNQPEHSGVIMTFAWFGKYQNVPIDYGYRKMSNNILYRQGSWRHFIKAPIMTGNLKLCNVQLINKNGYSEFETLDGHIEKLVIKKHKILSLIPTRKKKLCIKEKKEFLNRIKSSYYPQPLIIDIAH